MALYPIIAAVVLILDQLSKFFIRSNFVTGEKISVIGEWFTITFVKNTGAAFSMFAGNEFVTIFMTSALIVACLIFIANEFKNGGSRFLSICLTLIVSGGIGNLIDRVSLGYVTDMISFGNFPVFNIADIAVTCGCFLTVIYILFFHKNPDSADLSAEETKDASSDEAKNEVSTEETKDGLENE